MTFNVKDTYEKNLAEFKELAAKHQELNEKIVEAQKDLNTLFIAAKQKEAVVNELAPYLDLPAEPVAVETPQVDQEAASAVAA